MLPGMLIVLAMFAASMVLSVALGLFVTRLALYRLKWEFVKPPCREAVVTTVAVQLAYLFYFIFLQHHPHGAEFAGMALILLGTVIVFLIGVGLYPLVHLLTYRPANYLTYLGYFLLADFSVIALLIRMQT